MKIFRRKSEIYSYARLEALGLLIGSAMVMPKISYDLQIDRIPVFLPFCKNGYLSLGLKLKIVIRCMFSLTVSEG